MSIADTPPRAAPQGALRYTDIPPPATGQSVEIAPGVRWVRMPLPYSIDHINVWLIQDGQAWTLVDTGACTDDVKQAWLDIRSETGEPLKIHRLIATHMHPDHVGLAGWLHDRFGASLAMTRQEYLACRVEQADMRPGDRTCMRSHFHKAGWTQNLIVNHEAHCEQQRQYTHPLPASFDPLQHGDELKMGDHTWQVLVGQGHTSEHACLYCPALKLLISGDQVLPKISSNLSVHPMQPNANPLAQWFESMLRLRQAVPDDVLVLPAHNLPFHGLHERLHRLESGQMQSLERLRAALDTPRRVVDLFAPLFNRSMREDDPGLMELATGEALANLNYLRGLDEINSSQDENGVDWYLLR